jgi:hypothetical protein
VERSAIRRALIVIGAAVLFVVGCANPFAPSLRGSTGSLWTDASTVGELLQNFATAYELRDSLRYSELLAEDFQFQYFDPELNRTEGWYRETDLRATARMFRSFENIALVWQGLPAGSDTIATEDTPVNISVQYKLDLDELSSVIGFARFTLLKQANDRFRIVLWQDDF